MSSLKGSFQSCKEGNSSATMTCTGASCAGLSKIPGITCKGDPSTSLTCTNGITCASVSNLTSSYAMQGNGLKIIQTHNITVGSQTFTVMGNGANFTKTNTTSTTTHSTAPRLHRPGLKTFFLIAFLLFTTQAYAQSPDSGVSAIENQFISSLGGILDPLMDAVCTLVTTPPFPTNEIEEIEEEVLVLATCLELLIIALIGAVTEAGNVLGGAVPQAIVYGSSLPITDPETLFFAAAGDAILCLELAAAIMDSPGSTSAAGVCDPILADAAPVPTASGAAPADTSAPTESAAAPTNTSAPTSTDGSAAASTGAYYIPSGTAASGLPPGWPAASVWATGNGSYIAFELSEDLSSDLLDASLCLNNETTPQWTAFDLSQYFCTPDNEDADFQTMCNYLCRNPCTLYSVNVLADGLGTAYTGGNNKTDTDPLCTYGAWGGDGIACLALVGTNVADESAVEKCVCEAARSVCNDKDDNC